MENVIISNPELLREKKKAFKEGGKDNLHVLSDFDRTLTKAISKGVKTPSIISYLRNGAYLSEDYAKKAHELFDRYHPMEISPSLDIKTKRNKMLEWWTSHYKLLAESGLDKNTIQKAVLAIVNEGAIELRAGVSEFFNILNMKNIPIIIMSSSGIGNMVTEFLAQNKMLSTNVHFIGNTLDFDVRGNFKGIKGGKVIHVLNKHEIEIKGLPFYSDIKERRNIILLGDSLGDIGMLEGADYSNVIKIGFYNNNEENLEEFKKNFDVIITNDGSFDFINKLMNEII